VFYSGDKSGIVCKVDVEDCSEVADGVCIVLAREPSEEVGEGINKIVTADDGLLWTASGGSSISRWKIPKRLSKCNTDEDRDLFAGSPVTTITRRRVSIGTEPSWSGTPSVNQGKCVQRSVQSLNTHAMFKAGGTMNCHHTQVFLFRPWFSSRL
jgi:WD repeat-containing protein 48